MKTLIIIGFLLASSVAYGQQAYDLNKAKFFWSMPTGGGPYEGFKIKCGSSAGNYPNTTSVPDPSAREFPIKPVVVSSGQYYCIIVSYTKAAESPASSEIFFYAVDSASTPTEFRIGY